MTDLCSFIFTTNLRQTYNKLTTDFGIDLRLNCRNILCNRPVIEFSKYIMQQTCDRLFLQQTYNKFTTNLQQTYDRLTTDLQQTLE